MFLSFQSNSIGCVKFENFSTFQTNLFTSSCNWAALTKSAAATWANLHLTGSELSSFPVPSTSILMIILTLSQPLLQHCVVLTTSDETLLDFLKSHYETELSNYTLVFCSILSQVPDMRQEMNFRWGKL